MGLIFKVQVYKIILANERFESDNTCRYKSFLAYSLEVYHSVKVYYFEL